MTVSKQLIDNINDLRKSLNEISVYDLDVYTSMELYYNIAKKLNEVITEMMRFEGLVSDEVVKQNEKLIYLLAEGLNIEVVNKINDMILKGEMYEIINNEVFEDFNNELKIKANKNEVVKKGYGTLSDFDEETRRLIQGLDSGEVNAVLGKDNVLIENLNGEIKDNITEYVDDNVKYEGKNGMYSVTSDGLFQDFAGQEWAKGYIATKIECEEGDKFKVSCKVSGTGGALALFYDSADSYVSAYRKVADVGDNIIYDNEVINIPTNIKHVAFYTSDKVLCPLVIKKLTKKVVNTLKIKNEIEEIKTKLDKNDVFDFYQLMKNQYSLEKKNPFEWKQFDKGYFTFIFDDGRHDLNKVADIFKEYNIPLCVAIPTDKLHSRCDDGQTILNTCKRIVQNGGEVLSHSIDNTVFTDKTTKEEAIKKLRDSKLELEKNGIIVNGFIMPGGSGMLQRLDKFMDIMYYYYDYSDMGSNTDIAYNKERIYLNTPQNTLLNTIIKPVCTGGGFMTFMAHTLDGTEGIINEQKLRETIEFIQNNGGKIVTYKYVFDNFRSSKLENLLP